MSVVDIHCQSESAASSISKAMGLLAALADSKQCTLGVSELALAAGVPKSTAHRLLKELQHHDLVDRSGSKYCLGVGLFELSAAARWSSYGRLRDLAAPTLEWLFERVNQTVHLAVCTGDEVVYLEKITASGGCRIPSRVGITLPVTCTSLGKAMLAFSSTRNVADILSRPLPCLTPYSVVNPRVLASELTEIRQSGVAVDRDGARLGVSCVAAPVLLAGKAIAAVSVAGWGDSFSPPRYANLIREAATRITALLS